VFRSGVLFEFGEDEETDQGILTPTRLVDTSKGRSRLLHSINVLRSPEAALDLDVAAEQIERNFARRRPAQLVRLSAAGWVRTTDVISTPDGREQQRLLHSSGVDVWVEADKGTSFADLAAAAEEARKKGAEETDLPSTARLRQTEDALAEIDLTQVELTREVQTEDGVFDVTEKASDLLRRLDKQIQQVRRLAQCLKS
jgi:hypothetical protein